VTTVKQATRAAKATRGRGDAVIRDDRTSEHGNCGHDIVRIE
jgi:hypothetical protein